MSLANKTAFKQVGDCHKQPRVLQERGICQNPQLASTSLVYSTLFLIHLKQTMRGMTSSQNRRAIPEPSEERIPEWEPTTDLKNDFLQNA